MNAPFTLRARLQYSRPRFHPGQILPDTALTHLGDFAAVNLEAAARRPGWGVVQGLAPRIETVNGNATVCISPGVAVDQMGRMIVIEDAGCERLDKLVAIPPARSDGEIPLFDLWLSMDSEKYGGSPNAWRLLPDDSADPPMPADRIPPQKTGKPEQSEQSGDPAGRAPRLLPVAKLELRPAKMLDDLREARQQAYDKFKKTFDEAGQSSNQAQRTLDEIQKARLALLAQELSKPSPSYNGIPLGRIGIEAGTGKPIGDFDLAYARAEARDELPAPPGHVNLARVLGMETNAARAWLTAHGFQPWTEDVIAGDDEPDRLAWDLALRPGDTVRLFTLGGRIAVVREGPSLPFELLELDRRLTSAEGVIARLSQAVVLLAVVLFGLFIAMIAAWMDIKDLDHRVPKAEAPSAVTRVV